MPPKYLAMWGGSILDYEQPIYLIAGENRVAEAVRILHKIGMDKIAGYFSAEEVADKRLNTATIAQKSAEEVVEFCESNDVSIVDVRGQGERASVRIPNSKYAFLGKINQQLEPFERDQFYVFQCQSGGRSVVAASIAAAAGFKNVINLEGGIQAWQQAGYPVEVGQQQPVQA